MRQRLDPATVGRVAARLRAGEVLAVPTDTFYGLAADAGNRRAVERVNALKGKPAASPVLVLASDRVQVETVAETGVEGFDALAEAFWPGPLTLVLRAKDGVPAPVRTDRGTIAVRVPDAPWPRALAHALGRPVTAPSANRHAGDPPATAAAVRAAFGRDLDGVVDGGTTPGGAPSTLLDLSGDAPRVLREGAVSLASLRSARAGNSSIPVFPDRS